MAVNYFGKDRFDNADISFQGLGELIATNVVGALAGCLDSSMYSYNPNANADCDGNFPGSPAFNAADPTFGVTTCCVSYVYGCTDPTADNYDPNANVSNSSCQYLGCTDPNFVEYDPNANVDDGTCATPIVYGCMDTSTNTIGDGSGFAYENYTNGNINATNPCDGINGDPCVADPYGTMQTILTSPMGCCCEHTVVGCMDPTATNNNPNANTPPASGSTLSCIYAISGCTHNISAVTNYDPTATVDDGSCIYVGCSDNTAVNYSYFVNPADGNTYYATVDDGSCTYAAVSGCMMSWADNYDPLATTEDGTCLFSGCGYLDLSWGPNEQLSLGANSSYIINSGVPINGIYLEDLWLTQTSPYSYPQSPTGTITLGVNFTDDGSCNFTGCADPTAPNYQPPINHPSWPGAGITDDGTCMSPAVLGCTNSSACNYDPSATVDDGSCHFLFGCTDFGACNYNPQSICDDGSCIMPDPITGLCPQGGCTDPTACNYSATATFDDGSCTGLLGCTDPTAVNYDPLATCDDGSCSTLIVNGCTDPNSCTYNSNATPGNPTATSACSGYYGCTDSSSSNYDPGAGCDDGSCVACVYGCTDPLASNYDVSATCDNGTCNPAPPSCTGSNGTTFTVGQSYNGGIIFYLEGTDCGGAGVRECVAGGTVVGSCGIYIAEDNGTFWPYGTGGIWWGCAGTSIFSSPTDTQAIGTGYDNDIQISATCPNPTAYCAANYIDYQNSNNSALLGGYSDYFLPSQDEAIKMYNNIGPGNALGLGNIANFTTGTYLWTSTEVNAQTAIKMYTFDGSMSSAGKNSANEIKFVRREGSSGCTDNTPGIYSDVNGGCIDSNGNAYTVGTLEECNNQGDGYTMVNYDPSAAFDDGSCKNAYYIGDYYQGGIIYYLNNGVDHTGGGLIVTEGDIIGSNGVQWGCMGVDCGTTQLTSIGEGQQATNLALACVDPSTGTSCGPTAAINADNHSVTDIDGNVWDDWYLPSKDELIEIYNAIGEGSSVGNVLNLNHQAGGKAYLSSNEYSQALAWLMYPVSGTFVLWPHNQFKNTYHHVLAIRSF